MFVKIQLGVCSVYVLSSLILTTAFAAHFWDTWSFSTLGPQALAYGFSWPVWMLA